MENSNADQKIFNFLTTASNGELLQFMDYVNAEPFSSGLKGFASEVDNYRTLKYGGAE